jgi:uncharacterized membrane protein YdbT with pleckstrin-like domain
VQRVENKRERETGMCKLRAKLNCLGWYCDYKRLVVDLWCRTSVTSRSARFIWANRESPPRQRHSKCINAPLNSVGIVCAIAVAVANAVATVAVAVAAVIAAAAAAAVVVVVVVVVPVVVVVVVVVEPLLRIEWPMSRIN